METLSRRICNLCLEPPHRWEQALTSNLSPTNEGVPMSFGIGDAIEGAVTDAITEAILGVFTGSLESGSDTPE
ncbi:hypothetical protein GOALK_050_00610 [Gordonia alkanivorans NBRC 16433]|uniref:Uncharacterized protein n=2 Tax=Gordonia alkanivorans TaxID=84096 RepID=F9VUB8_9ACTN|nr:hypothetical protein GOALK_050_00610 [Gordonia alkanivorans NBRC 16433]